MTTSRSFLPLILASINATLTSLKTPGTPAADTTEQGEESTTTSQIRSDFLTLLALLSKQSTNYTLALKNPPEEKAAFQTLEKVRDGVDKLKFLQELLRGRPGELDKRLRWALSESLESLSSFLNLSSTYLPPNPTTTTSEDRKRLLSSCKTFWNVVETIERELPENELAAVRTSWKDVTQLLEDCEGEIRELIEGNSSNEDEKDSDDREQSEDEQEEEGEEELSETQKAIVLTAQSLLRYSRLLIVRLLAFTESRSTTTSTVVTADSPSLTTNEFDSIPFLADLTQSIKLISEKADDLAGVLDEVEDVDDEVSIREAIKAVTGEIVEISERVAKGVEVPASSVRRGAEEGERIEKFLEWIKLWRTQRDNAQKKLGGLLR